MHGPLHVLLVDDDLIFCEYFQSLSSPYNLIIDVLHTYQEAKNAIESKKFDAYVIDVNLPDGSGFDLAELVREKKGHEIPIAAISGVFRDSDSFRKLKENLKINYVIDKPIQPDQIQSLLTQLCSAKPAAVAHLEDALKKLRDKYDTMVPSIIADLEKLIENIKKKPDKDSISELRKSVHKIAGSAGSVGYPEVSTLCKTWELDLIKKMDQVDSAPVAQDWLKAQDEYLRKLKFAYQLTTDDSEKALHISATGSDLARPPLYVVDSDRKLLESLEKEQAGFNINVITEWDPNKAKQQLASNEFNPRIVIVGNTFRGSVLRGEDLLEQVRKKSEPLPTTFGLILEKEDLKTSSDAIKKGITYILQKPISAELFLTTIRNELQYENHRSLKVLVVDDDPFVCDFISACLTEVGMEVKSLTDGTQLFATLQSFMPNVLLLDIYLPGYNGVELLKSLRSDIRYLALMIVIITASQDIPLLTEAYTGNVDEILHKPLDKKIVQARIASLAKRNSAIGQFQKRDEITGLPNENALQMHIHQDLLQPDIARQGHFLAVMEIDRFREIAASTERSYSEGILTAFSNLMLRNLNRLGFCAALGRGKFALASEPTDLATLKHHIETFLVNAQREIQLPQNLGKLTFSCGITSLPTHHMPVDAVFKQAEETLTSAKKMEAQNPIKIATNIADGKGVPLEREMILIDTDADLLKVLRSALESNGIKVKSYNLGEPVLEELLVNQHSFPPLIIMERLLPDMDGLDFLKRLRKKFPVQIPLIFLTTLSAEKDVFEGLKAGALDYIAKPFSLNLLVQKCLTALNR